ncbi:MAG: hypothetical protein DRR19_03235 [Candidatus Parabeggiatoa sp. nov. 1]|nr:MAG: hypothetical protein DRR19_03235 [Gammaproteobacteria bacterium]
MKPSADILIVDDIEANRQALCDSVTKLEHTPILAENGPVALDKLKTQPIDLILLDILIPKIDGNEVLSHIKNDVSLQDIPVIMTTVLDETEKAVSYIKMGAEDYLIKPVNPVLFNARIGACLEIKHLRDKEEDYLHQIEEANFRLEELICEQTKELTIANEKLRMIIDRKGKALKYFHRSLHSLFKTEVVKEHPEHANKLLEKVGHSVELTNIEPSMVVFELNAVRAILQSAITLATAFAQSRQVLIGSKPDCGEQAFTQNGQTVVDDEQSTHQKEFCVNALAELINTAIKFSHYGSTVTFSCEPLQKEISIGIHATGKMIAEDELSQFFEVPSNTEKDTPGIHLGLGPSTAKHIITRLGGSVTVANRDSAGISFVVTLKLRI